MQLFPATLAPFSGSAWWAVLEPWFSRASVAWSVKPTHHGCCFLYVCTVLGHGRELQEGKEMLKVELQCRESGTGKGGPGVRGSRPLVSIPCPALQGCLGSLCSQCLGFPLCTGPRQSWGVPPGAAAGGSRLERQTHGAGPGARSFPERPAFSAELEGERNEPGPCRIDVTHRHYGWKPWTSRASVSCSSLPFCPARRCWEPRRSPAPAAGRAAGVGQA